MRLASSVLAVGTMTETLLRVKRGEGCDCDMLLDLKYMEVLHQPEDEVPDSCPHGSTVEEVPARLVECEECRGEGRILCPTCRGLKCVKCDFSAQVACPNCLSTGLRLAPKEQ